MFPYPNKSSNLPNISPAYGMGCVALQQSQNTQLLCPETANPEWHLLFHCADQTMPTWSQQSNTLGGPPEAHCPSRPRAQISRQTQLPSGSLCWDGILGVAQWKGKWCLQWGKLQCYAGSGLWAIDWRAPFKKNKYILLKENCAVGTVQWFQTFPDM